MSRMGDRLVAGGRRVQLGWVAMGAVVITAASLWLPWHRSGALVRNAFELLDSAGRSEIGPGPLMAVLRVVVAIAPALAAVAWLARIGGVGWIFVTAGTVVAGAVGCGAVVLMTASSDWRSGAVLGLVGSGTTVAALMAEWWLRRRGPPPVVVPPRALEEDT